MKTRKFTTLEELDSWCKDNPDELVYWGFPENQNNGEWYSTTDLKADAEPAWFENPDTGEPLEVEIYIKD